MAIEAMKNISLYRLAPAPEGSQEHTLRFSAQLAAILNWDQGLPDSVKRKEQAPVLSDMEFLDYTQKWCREKLAQSFAVVRDDAEAVGLMSLSHIDLGRETARTGMFLASDCVGLGIPARAFILLLKVAHSLGIRQVSGAIPELENVESGVWHQCGAMINFEPEQIVVSLQD